MKRPLHTMKKLTRVRSCSSTHGWGSSCTALPTKGSMKCYSGAFSTFRERSIPTLRQSTRNWSTSSFIHTKIRITLWPIVTMRTSALRTSLKRSGRSRAWTPSTQSRSSIRSSLPRGLTWDWGNYFGALLDSWWTTGNLMKLLEVGFTFLSPVPRSNFFVCPQMAWLVLYLSYKFFLLPYATAC